jgi:hypothetical protein
VNPVNLIRVFYEQKQAAQHINPRLFKELLASAALPYLCQQRIRHPDRIARSTTPW